MFTTSATPRKVLALAWVGGATADAILTLESGWMQPFAVLWRLEEPPKQPVNAVAKAKRERLLWACLQNNR